MLFSKTRQLDGSKFGKLPPKEERIANPLTGVLDPSRKEESGVDSKTNTWGERQETSPRDRTMWDWVALETGPIYMMDTLVGPS